MSDTAEKRHRGHVLVKNEEGFELRDIEPHYHHECDEKAAEAASHPTETPCTAKVGYSAGYAARFDAAFGRN